MASCRDLTSDTFHHEADEWTRMLMEDQTQQQVRGHLHDLLVIESVAHGYEQQVARARIAAIRLALMGVGTAWPTPLRPAPATPAAGAPVSGASAETWDDGDTALPPGASASSASYDALDREAEEWTQMMMEDETEQQMREHLDDLWGIESVAHGYEQRLARARIRAIRLALMGVSTAWPAPVRLAPASYY